MSDKLQEILFSPIVSKFCQVINKDEDWYCPIVRTEPYDCTPYTGTRFIYSVDILDANENGFHYLSTDSFVLFDNPEFMFERVDEDTFRETDEPLKDIQHLAEMYSWKSEDVIKFRKTKVLLDAQAIIRGVIDEIPLDMSDKIDKLKEAIALINYRITKPYRN